MDSMSAISPANPAVNLPQIHPISVKLDRSNYSFWKAQIATTVRAFGFDDVLQNNSAPSQYLDSASSENVQNPSYLVWLRRNQFVFSWILTFISPSMIGYVGRCTFSAEILLAFEKDILDQLYNIGQPISKSDLVTHVLAGLGQEFESISVFLQSTCEELTLHELQFALQTHEIRIHNQAIASGNLSQSVFSSQANTDMNNLLI
ncbi:uncharacterized protein LOC131018491 [Salvia miltiorrhiza]|uniref:uncharacterized protein LOC131018491 n=1 Tax=Salvia miltiorrhiza TaxID=226208 RepID=UPI0025ACDE3B|nr:uncharacterized protein LOC131018491 [Salvia miltiorrhiza]